MWKIVINGPGYFDTPFDLAEGVITLGRADDNDVVLSGDLVSRQHARIHTGPDGVKLEDLGSRNGSRINGRGVQGVHVLHVGDVVAVGENTFTLREAGPTDAVATEVHSSLSRMVDEPARDVASAVIYSRKVRESVVLRALDNVFPFALDEGVNSPMPPVGPVDPETPSAIAAPASSSAPPAPPAHRDAPSYEAVLLLYKVAESLVSAATLEDFLATASGLLRRATRATTSVVLLRQPSGALEPASVHHEGQLPEGAVPVSSAIVDEALKQGAALVLADARNDERFSTRQSVVMYGTGQVLCIPLGKKEPYAGVLYLTRPALEGPETFESLVDLCTAVGHLVATGVEKFAHKRPAPNILRLESVLERAHPPEVYKRRLAEYAQQGHTLTRVEDVMATVLFADLSGFSGLSRKLEPTALTDLLQEFYSRMATILFSFEGTVATFVGDSVLGLFGAPYPRADDAARAVRAALAIRSDWQKMMMKHPASERCQVKIGLHTGNLLAGTVGSERRVEYAAVGEPVNLAAWLVGFAGADQILITGRTRSAVGNRFEVSSLGERAVHSGSKEKLALFEVLEEDLGVRTNPGVEPA